MRAWDCLLAFPGVFLAMRVVAVLAPGPINPLMAVAIINVPIFAPLARAGALAEKEKDYVKRCAAWGPVADASCCEMSFLTLRPPSWWR